MCKLSILLLALGISSIAKADSANKLNQQARQIDRVSENIQQADGKTDRTAELESMGSHHRKYEQTSCDYLKRIRYELTVTPSAMQATLKQAAKKRLCGAKISMETSHAFEVEYAESNISSDILNTDHQGALASWVRTFKDGSSKISNF